MYRAYSICQVELKGLNLWNYKGYITGELAYDLQKAVAILEVLPDLGIPKIYTGIEEIKWLLKEQVACGSMV